MSPFARQIEDIRRYAAGKERRGELRRLAAPSPGSWPRAAGGALVLKDDTALEIGGPSTASCACLLWDERPGSVEDGAIRLAGPDAGEARGASLPFGKFVIVEVRGFDAGEAIDRYRAMEAARFDVDLEGYMVRAASQYLREWARISSGAVAAGFSLAHPAADLVARLKALPWVRAAEVLMVTSPESDVRELRAVAESAGEITRAMDRMLSDLSLDCDSCGFRAVCDEVEDLRRIHGAVVGTGGRP